MTPAEKRLAEALEDVDSVLRWACEALDTPEHLSRCIKAHDTLAALLAEIKALREGLEKIANQATRSPMPEQAVRTYAGGFDAGYSLASEHAARIARTLLALPPQGEQEDV